MSILNIFLRFLDRLEEFFLGICIIVMIVTNFLNVLCRFLLPQVPFSYTEELTILLFVWCTMLGIAAAFKAGAHPSLTIITDHLKPEVRKYAVLAATLFGIVVLCILIKGGWDASMNQISHGQLSPGLKISAAWQTMALPVGGVFILIRCVQAGITEFVALHKEGKEDAAK